MTRDLSFIKNRRELIAQYGEWPSFHDAIVEEVHLWRGHIRDGDWDDRNVLPVLTMVVRVLGATQSRATEATHDVVATLRFHDVDDVAFHHFNNVNVIVHLSFEVLPRTGQDGSPLLPLFRVVLEPGFGVVTSFICYAIEVLDAVAIAPDEPLLRPRLSTTP